MGFIRVIGLTGDIKVVPRSSFVNYLKDIGYREIGAKNTKNENEKDWNECADSIGEGNLQDNSVESIPLSEMNGKQLKEFAKLKGIDVSGAQSTKEAREIIRMWIHESGE